MRSGFVWHLVWLAALLPGPPMAAGSPPSDPPRSEASPPAAETAPAAAQRAPEGVAELVRQTADSVVVITGSSRDGSSRGVGTGFIVSADGLVATNLHVIGEARPIGVQFRDGTKRRVTAVHAFSREQDLAVLRIDAAGLRPLGLAEPGTLEQGQPVIALGNPFGLRHSVVSGIVSAMRQMDGQDLIQLAMPVEPGNSGGPLLDLEGRVQGVLSMKSLVTANLGFAVAVAPLRELLDSPHPIPMSRWLTIGALNPDQWQVRLGAHWRQRAGRIVVEGFGEGFGGRSQCFWQPAAPPLPFELAVSVKLADESGAAGLIFAADGEDRHYGFYPSGGKLRFTRFAGPDVGSWTILFDQPSPHYRPGDWNVLKIRHADEGTACFVNDELVYESRDRQLRGTRVGLAQFRGTRAEFRHFRLGDELPRSLPTDDEIRRAVDVLPGRSPGGLGDPALAPLLQSPAQNVAALRMHARALEREATRLQRWSELLHRRSTTAQLAGLLNRPDDRIDLFEAALWVARLDDDEVDVAAYRAELAAMVDELRREIAPEAGDREKLAALKHFLFDEHGFHGSRSDYYHRANSHIHEVLDDREGLPITLSILYLELAQRIGLAVEGVGLPGHFVVAYCPDDAPRELIDVFDAARPVSRDEAAARVQAATGTPLGDEMLAPADKRAIIVRVLRNLLGIARSEADLDGMLKYVEAILAIAPDSAAERWTRALVNFQLGALAAARDDVDWLLAQRPAGLDLEPVESLKRLLGSE